MAASSDFLKKYEHVLKTLLQQEFPYMKTGSQNEISRQCTQHLNTTIATVSAEASGADATWHDLPPEIRVKIFALAMAPKDGLPILIRGCPFNSSCRGRCPGYDSGRTYRPDGPKPGVMQVCKLWRVECLPIFYGQMQFRVCASRGTAFIPLLPPQPPFGLAALQSFLAMIGQTNAAKIKLTIHSDSAGDEAGLRTVIRNPSKWRFEHVI